jgi:hypothetical protein
MEHEGRGQCIVRFSFNFSILTRSFNVIGCSQEAA